jgi:hypothetical protein
LLTADVAMISHHFGAYTDWFSIGPVFSPLRGNDAGYPQYGQHRYGDGSDDTAENSYIESFNARPGNELLNREVFLHFDELRCIVERWRMDYNYRRPHGSLGYMMPAAFTVG